MRIPLVVNSLGEVINSRTDECVGNTINALDAIKVHDPELFYNPKLRKEWEKDYTKTGKRHWAACDKAWRLRMYENLPYKHALWVFKVWELQKLNDEFCRVWGQHGRIWASVEFSNFEDNRETREWWAAVNKQAAKFADRLFFLARFRHCDQKYDKDKKRYIAGPDHDRMRKQVAIEMELKMGDTITQVKAARKYIMRFFKQFWDKYGVQVC